MIFLIGNLKVEEEEEIKNINKAFCAGRFISTCIFFMKGRLLMTTTTQLIPRLNFETVPKNVTKHYIVIGAGGTGGYVIPQLARMVSIASDESIKSNPDTITIIDKDVVEHKNLKRQNFIMSDLGKNKAEVMQQRYSKGFDFNIACIPTYIESSEMLTRYIGSLNLKNSLIVLIDCTDNNKTRILIHKAIEEYMSVIPKYAYGVYFVSSGNEEMHGQVSFSAKLNPRKLIKDKFLPNLRDIDKRDFFKSIKETQVFNIPTICELFPDMEVGKLPDEESCAERSVSAPQNIQTNYMAADIVLNYLNKIINNMPITQFLIFFDITSSSTNPFVFSKEDLDKVFSMVEGNAYASKYIDVPAGKVSIPTQKELDKLKEEAEAILKSEKEAEGKANSEEEVKETKKKLKKNTAQGEEIVFEQVPGVAF